MILLKFLNTCIYYYISPCRFVNQTKKIETLPPIAKQAEPLEEQKTKNNNIINEFQNLNPVSTITPIKNVKRATL